MEVYGVLVDRLSAIQTFTCVKVLNDLLILTEEEISPERRLYQGKFPWIELKELLQSSSFEEKRAQCDLIVTLSLFDHSMNGKIIKLLDQDQIPSIEDVWKSFGEEVVIKQLSAHKRSRLVEFFEETCKYFFYNEADCKAGEAQASGIIQEILEKFTPNLEEVAGYGVSKPANVKQNESELKVIIEHEREGKDTYLLLQNEEKEARSVHPLVSATQSVLLLQRCSIIMPFNQKPKKNRVCYSLSPNTQSFGSNSCFSSSHHAFLTQNNEKIKAAEESSFKNGYASQMKAAKCKKRHFMEVLRTQTHYSHILTVNHHFSTNNCVISSKNGRKQKDRFTLRTNDFQNDAIGSSMPLWNKNRGFSNPSHSIHSFCSSSLFLFDNLAFLCQIWQKQKNKELIVTKTLKIMQSVMIEEYKVINSSKEVKILLKDKNTAGNETKLLNETVFKLDFAAKCLNATYFLMIPNKSYSSDRFKIFGCVFSVFDSEKGKWRLKKVNISSIFFEKHKIRLKDEVFDQNPSGNVFLAQISFIFTNIGLNTYISMVYQIMDLNLFLENVSVANDHYNDSYSLLYSVSNVLYIQERKDHKFHKFWLTNSFRIAKQHGNTFNAFLAINLDIGVSKHDNFAILVSNLCYSREQDQFGCFCSDLESFWIKYCKFMLIVHANLFFGDVSIANTCFSIFSALISLDYASFLVFFDSLLLIGSISLNSVIITHNLGNWLNNCENLIYMLCSLAKDPIDTFKCLVSNLNTIRIHELVLVLSVLKDFNLFILKIPSSIFYVIYYTDLLAENSGHCSLFKIKLVFVNYECFLIGIKIRLMFCETNRFSLSLQGFQEQTYQNSFYSCDSGLLKFELEHILEKESAKKDFSLKIVEFCSYSDYILVFQFYKVVLKLDSFRKQFENVIVVSNNKICEFLQNFSKKRCFQERFKDEFHKHTAVCEGELYSLFKNNNHHLRNKGKLILVTNTKTNSVFVPFQENQIVFNKKHTWRMLRWIFNILSKFPASFSKKHIKSAAEMMEWFQGKYFKLQWSSTSTVSGYSYGCNAYIKIGFSYQEDMTIVALFFPSPSFVPLGFLGKVFNEAQCHCHINSKPILRGNVKMKTKNVPHFKISQEYIIWSKKTFILRNYIFWTLFGTNNTYLVSFKHQPQHLLLSAPLIPPNHHI